MYITVSHCVCPAVYEMGVNRGLILIVIVIVIVCHFMPLFFLKSGTLLWAF